MNAEEKIQKANLDMARVGRLLSASEDGRLLLDILRSEFYDGPMVGREPHETYFNLGRREVVGFLIGLRDRVEEK